MLSRSQVRAVVRTGGFRRLLSVRLTSQLADGLFQAGLAGSILFNPQQRADAVAIAIGFAVLLLPYSMLGPYVGVFLDRWSRRNILVYANTTRAVGVLPTAALIAFGSNQVLFLLSALVVIAINRFVLAGLSAALPHVVDDDLLVTANALGTTLGTVCYSLGLGAAVLLRPLVGTGSHGYALIACTAVLGYLIAALLARVSFAPHRLGPDEAERVRGHLGAAVVDIARGMVEGARHLAHRPLAGSVLLAQATHRAFYGVLAIATLLLFRYYFSTEIAGAVLGVASVVIAGAAGTLLAAVVTPVVVRRVGGRRWVTALLGGVGGVVLVLGLPFEAALLVVAVLFINVASQGTKIVVDTALQHECADDHRGRVFSLNDTAFNASYVVGLFVGALTLPADGHAPVAVVVVSVGYAGLALAYGWLSGRWSRRLGRDIATTVSTS